GYYGRSAQEIRQWLDEDGLKAYGSHTQLDALKGDQFDKTVEFNKVLGNKLIVVPWIPVEMRNSRAKLLETCQMFNELGQRLAKQGMILSYHNHMDEFKVVDGEMPWYTFFANTDPRYVKIEFDTGNAMEAGQ